MTNQKVEQKMKKVNEILREVREMIQGHLEDDPTNPLEALDLVESAVELYGNMEIDMMYEEQQEEFAFRKNPTAKIAGTSKIGEVVSTFEELEKAFGAPIEARSGKEERRGGKVW